jgi:hypothetical protein
MPRLYPDAANRFRTSALSRRRMQLAPRPHWYVLAVGVAPEKQGLGRDMSLSHSMCGARRQTVCLATTSLRKGVNTSLSAVIQGTGAVCLGRTGRGDGLNPGGFEPGGRGR